MLRHGDFVTKAGLGDPVQCPLLTTEKSCSFGGHGAPEVGGIATHELLPLPMNDAMASHLAERIRRAQDALGIPMAVENVSSYARMPGSSMSEAEFVATVCERADCRLLLDVNNVYVNSKNHGFDAREMIAALPLDRVEQLHVAGHEQKPGGGLLDTHAEAVCEDVWNLLEWTLERTGPRPVLLERDGSFPAWAEVVREIRRCHEVADRAERRRFGRVASKVSPNLECACP